MAKQAISVPAPPATPEEGSRAARAKARRDAEDATVRKMLEDAGVGRKKTPVERLNAWRAEKFEREWGWVVGVFVWFL